MRTRKPSTFAQSAASKNGYRPTHDVTDADACNLTVADADGISAAAKMFVSAHLWSKLAHTGSPTELVSRKATHLHGSRIELTYSILVQRRKDWENIRMPKL